MLKICYEIKNTKLLQDVKEIMESKGQDDWKEQSSLRILFIEVNSAEQVDEISSIIKKYADFLPYEIIFVGKDEYIIFPLLPYKPLYFVRELFIKDDVVALQKLLHKKILTNQQLVVKSGNAIIRIYSRSILYIESYGHYLTIHTQNGQYRVRDKLSTFLVNAECTAFIRTHKSFAVNIEMIEEITAEFVVLRNTTEKIAIGRSYRQSVLTCFNQQNAL